MIAQHKKEVATKEIEKKQIAAAWAATTWQMASSLFQSKAEFDTYVGQHMSLARGTNAPPALMSPFGLGLGAGFGGLGLGGTGAAGAAGASGGAGAAGAAPSQVGSAAQFGPFVTEMDESSDEKT
jgi:hypothetical protein